MRFVTALLYCLLSLFGCEEHAGTTTITRAAEAGRDTLFSKATWREGVATFQCFASRSGRCHYRLFVEQCAAQAGSPGGRAASCSQRALDDFSLDVGQRRDLRGLPPGFRLCVQSEPAQGPSCG